MSDWEVQRATGRCVVTGRMFVEGEPYFAALFETPTGVERRDYCTEAWSGPPEGSFCHWRTRVPVREKKKHTIVVDQTVLTNLFLRLEEETSEVKQQFRFVLALLLMRKRLLRYEQTVRDGEHEYWQMRLLSEQSVHQVRNPQLTDEQVERLSAQLTAILSGDVEAVDAIENAPSEPAPQPSGSPDAAAPAGEQAGDAPAPPESEDTSVPV